MNAPADSNGPKGKVQSTHALAMKFILPWFMWLWVGLSGCTPSTDPKAFFETLLERMANVTEVPLRSGNLQSALPTFPRPRDVVLPMDDIRVGFSTYIGLGRCGLVGEVSARNSSLGKFQSATARLLYEKRFLGQLRGCTSGLKPETEAEQKFLTELQLIESRKTALLPVVFWNATFGSPEFRVLLSTSTGPLAMRSEVSSSEILGALHLIAALGPDLESPIGEVGQSELESQYYRLQSSKLVGQLLQGMVIASDYLQQGSQLLETAAAQNSLCPMGKKTVRGGYLFNVFQKFYIGEAQPYISLLHSRARPIVEALDELVKLQTVPLPGAFQSFYSATVSADGPQSVWVVFNQALSRHTRAWQTVLKQCELMPRS